MCRSFSRWHRLWLLVGIGVSAFLTPAAVRADDPVEALKKTLKDGDWEKADRDTAKFKTLSQLRRGYFVLSEWTNDLDVKNDLDAKKNAKQRAQKAKLDGLRNDIAEKLVERIKSIVLGQVDPAIAVDRKIAACILIAEIAEADQPDQRGPTGKFASRFTPLLVGLLAKDNGVYREKAGVRQAALHALGKVTPPPEQAMPVLRSVLNGDELGPRLLAAYALTDLVKNAPFLPRKEEMATMNDAVAEAARLLARPNQDEQIRGYCLQTIQASARFFTDYRWTNQYGGNFNAEDRAAIHFEVVGKKLVLHTDLNKLLKTYQLALPDVISYLDLTKEESPKIRLTALDTISQIITARNGLLEKLQEERQAFIEELNRKRKKDEKEIIAEPLSRGEILQEFNTPDPIKPLLDGQWAVIPNLLQKSEDVRLKRGAMSILERVARDVETTQPLQTIDFVKGVTLALADSDRYVRWSAARTLGSISPNYMNGNVFEALGRMLIDPSQRDPDLNGAAAATMEKLADAPGAFVPKAINSLISAIEDPSMDSTNRVAAMRALVAIGAARPKGEDKLLSEERQREANRAFPQVTAAVGSDDAAIRREACLTLGQLGNPGRKDYYDDAISALKKAMRDDDTDIRLNASEAILTITPPR